MQFHEILLNFHGKYSKKFFREFDLFDFTSSLSGFFKTFWSIVFGWVTALVLTYFPVLEVIRKGHNTHFIHHVEAASSVKVEDGVEGPGVPVKEIFIVHQGIGIT